MPGPIARPGQQLSARALNDLNALARATGDIQISGGTQTGYQFTPDQEKGFFAEITAVGSSGWHSWERRIWQGYTATWITPPSPMKGDSTTNGAYNLSGTGLTVGDKVWLSPMGTRFASSQWWPVYQIVGGGGGSSGPTTDYVGEYVIGYYNGTSTLSGGTHGLGYTEVTVPTGTGSTPYSSTHILRLQHGSVSGTFPSGTGGVVYPWHATKESGALEIPTFSSSFSMPISAMRAICKRGPLVSGSTYDCHVFQVQPLMFYARCKHNGSGQIYWAPIIGIYSAPSSHYLGYWPESAASIGHALSWEILPTVLGNGANPSVYWATVYQNNARIPSFSGVSCVVQYTPEFGYCITNITQYRTLRNPYNTLPSVWY